MAILSKKQQDILAFIEKYHSQCGYPPTLREICKKFSISSTNGARYHLHRLKQMGYLEIEPNKSRGVKCVGNVSQQQEKSRSFRMPILGSVPAGPFDLASPDSNEEQLTVDPEFFGSRKQEPELFGLRVKGDSMIDEGIHDGDIVVVRAQPNANDGDIVVARWEEEATVKRFRRGGGQIILEPANPAYNPILIDDHGGKEEGQDIALLGVVVGLIRSM
ncbi:MAG: transcriptional repressor LexA [Candidatus Omnitrophica bacterium]|nr:transcriptional repressor LexA [Candidatus Omnitrophota bacterium]